MCAAPVGKWVVVRSDRLLVSIDKADHLYTIGRSRQLPSSQLLSHKYASREQLAIVWHPPHLYIAQRGRNPTFIGPDCDLVPRLSSEVSNATPGGAEPVTGATSLTDVASVEQHAELRLTATPTITAAALTKDAKGSLCVQVPLSDPLNVTQAPDRHAVTAATLYFPDEVGLPTLTIRFESAEVVREDATAAATTKTAAQMLAVPTFRSVEDDEDDALSETEAEDKLARKNTANRLITDNGASLPAEGATATVSNGDGGGGKPEWRGLLDVALQEQQRQESTARATGGPSNTATAPPPVPAPSPRPDPTPAPSPSIPFGGVTASAASAAPAANQQHHHTGFWEWKQHAKGKDDDPASWRKYNRAVAELLEKAYRDPSVAKIKIPDSAMFDKPGAKGSTYGVCFAEKVLDGAMIQYSLEDPGRFRVIRRTGGSPVDRKKAKKAHVIPSSSSSSESDSEDSLSDDDSDSDSEESFSSSSSSSSSGSDDAPRKKKRRH